MKYLIFILLVTFSCYGQNYRVDKVLGNVKVLKGTSETWENVKINDKLADSDLVLAENKSSVVLSKKGIKFLLNENAAIRLNHVKKVSTNDLILALALDEIRNVPKLNRKNISKNTAVYGSEISEQDEINPEKYDLGKKLINGAKILNESGFKVSSIIVAREVFRKYPVLASDFNERTYFANLLSELELYEEALGEIKKIGELSLSDQQVLILDEINKEISSELIKNN